MERTYYRCECCGAIVYRVPGRRYGDPPRMDTDENPVYIFDRWGDNPPDAIDARITPIPDCGCKGELTD
jgi:hypothetical protein